MIGWIGGSGCVVIRKKKKKKLTTTTARTTIQTHTSLTWIDGCMCVAGSRGWLDGWMDGVASRSDPVISLITPGN
jgi:hypothetical protein